MWRLIQFVQKIIIDWITYLILNLFNVCLKENFIKNIMLINKMSIVTKKNSFKYIYNNDEIFFLKIFIVQKIIIDWITYLILNLFNICLKEKFIKNIM